jgi:transposase-like protein
MKRKMTMFAVIAAVAVFALAGAAVASADGFGGASDAASSQWDRVAEILGMSPETLQSAIQQARSEERAARLEEHLTSAVEQGTITQDEANAISEWFNGKPEALSNLTHQQDHDLRNAAANDELAAFLVGLVTDGVLTQAEADEISTWIGAKPADALQKLAPNGFGGSGGFGGGFGPRGFGHHGFRGSGGPHGLGHEGFEGHFHGFGYPTQPDASPTPETGGNTGVAY